MNKFAFFASVSIALFLAACGDDSNSVTSPAEGMLSSSVVDPSTVVIDSITDSRDGQAYKTVTIGTQIWMAQNLNYRSAGSYCYNNDDSYCTKYGRLYTWAAAMDSASTWSTSGKGCGFGLTCSPAYPVRGVCPDGWHLPQKSEFETLFTAVGGQIEASKKLKTTSGWYSIEGWISNFGTDDYSFSALPAGIRVGLGGCINEGNYAYFWSSTENNDIYTYIMKLKYDHPSAFLDYNYYYKDNWYSVRCVKDK